MIHKAIVMWTKSMRISGYSLELPSKSLPTYVLTRAVTFLRDPT